MSKKELKLSNQVCFPIYTLSKIVIKFYTPYLKNFGLTYTQYLVLLVLWERDSVPVNFISKKLFIETNTLTPLLKRLEKKQLLKRFKGNQDERVVIISLTNLGKSLEEKLSFIPMEIYKKFDLENFDLRDFKKTLELIISSVK